MKNQLLNHLAHCALLLLVGLGACEPAEPEVAIDGVIRARINGQAWESAHIVWGGFSSRELSYPGRGSSPAFAWVKGTSGGDNGISLDLSANSHIFDQRGLLEIQGLQEVHWGDFYYYGEPVTTQIEIISADRLTRTIEGRFSFDAFCCRGWSPTRSVIVTDGYFKLTLP
jgi:hypothetical protein